MTPHAGPRPLGVVTGLEIEARLARRWGVPVAVGGGGTAGADAAAERLAQGDHGVQGLISFGLAGGLDPALQAGDLLVPEWVMDGGERWATDAGLNAKLGGGTGHAIRGGGLVLATVADKHAALQTGAQAVDLESAAIARTARRYSLPFAALRAVCDGAGRALPLAALVALDGAGRIGMLRVAGAVLARPWELPALLALARDAGRARAALAERVRSTSLMEAAP